MGLLLSLSVKGRLSRFVSDTNGLDPKWWLTCQVAPLCVFQLKNNAKFCRLLTVNSDTLMRVPATYSFEPKTAANIQRAFPCLVKVNVVSQDAETDKSVRKDFVYVVSGSSKRSVSRLCLSENVWYEDTAPINMVRARPSACYIKGVIYVFGGLTLKN